MLRERDTLSEVLYCIGLGPLAGEHEDSTVGPVQMRRDESRRDVASLPNGASPPADLTLCWALHVPFKTRNKKPWFNQVQT